MDALQFAYWLRGYTEITNGAQPDATQWQIIQDHLNEVFTKVTPNRHDPTLPQLTYYTSPHRVLLDGNQGFSLITC